eukprot:8434289-Pyramimonas_sp.AAC.1
MHGRDSDPFFGAFSLSSVLHSDDAMHAGSANVSPLRAKSSKPMLRIPTQTKQMYVKSRAKRAE